VAVQPVHYRFSVDEYERMGTAGILERDSRVELIDGEIVEMTPIGSRHAACVKRLNSLLVAALGDRAVVGVQDPVVLDEHSEPQPDISVLVPQQDYYETEHPRPSDILLVVEVADTSLAFDRNVKLPVYAAAGVPEVWLVDLVSGNVETHTEPSGSGYATVTVLSRGDTVTPAAFPDLTIASDAILG
jgi:Uma2 family endonuclease